MHTQMQTTKFLDILNILKCMMNEKERKPIINYHSPVRVHMRGTVNVHLAVSLRTEKSCF